MNGNQVIAKILKAEGVEWLACFPAQTLIDACAKEGIRPILARTERTGVNIADGFSRIKNGNKIGVFTMQTGPGSENAFGGIAQAYADSVPVLLLPGGQPSPRSDVRPNFEAIKNYGGITKWMANINMVSRIPELMGMAFSQLKHGRPGPVLLEIPDNIGVEEFPDDDFEYKPVCAFKSGADPDDVRDLVKAMLAAEYPIINAGQGVLYAEATDDLVELAELTNIPVMTTLPGKSAFPEDHPLALGAGGRTVTLMVQRALDKTDFVLGLGTSFTISSYNAPMPRGATLAQSTNYAEDVNKDYRIDFGAIGDARVVTRQLIEEAKSQLGEHGRGDVKGVRDEVAKNKQDFMQEWSPRLNSDEVPISPYRVFKELMNIIDPRDAIVTHDSGYPRDQLVPFWPALTPHGYIGWGKSTQLGYGLGLAMGAKMAQPEKHAINFMGDAAFGMAGMDIETAARSEIPILTIILNNGVMTGYSGHFPYAADKWGTNKLGGEYAKVAESLGAYAEKVETPDGVAPAINRALEANKSGQPALLEVMTKEERDVARFKR